MGSSRCRRESPVAEAARLIAAHRIGAVVVQDRGGNAIGLLSEFDIVRIVAERRAGIRGLAAEDAMRRTPISVLPDTSVADAIAMMADGDLRHLPVCTRDGRLLGLVGLRDLLRHRPDPRRPSGCRRGPGQQPRLCELNAAPLLPAPGAQPALAGPRFPETS
jgi:CBS domain-containing protein